MAVVSQAPFVTAQYFGDSGGSTQYWYWVQAVYPWGNSPLSSNLAAVTTLGVSHNNVVSINWSPPGPVGGVLYYNVWRTTSATPPSAGTNQCIAFGYPTVDGLVDNGLPGFTIAVGAVPTMMQELEREVKKSQEQAKSDAEKAKHEQDQMLNEVSAKQEKEDAKVLEDAQRAKQLDDLYRERFQLPVRETEAQKKSKSPEEVERAAHKAEVAEKATHYEPDAGKGPAKTPPAAPEKTPDTTKTPEKK